MTSLQPLKVKTQVNKERNKKGKKEVSYLQSQQKFTRVLHVSSYLYSSFFGFTSYPSVSSEGDSALQI